MPQIIFVFILATFLILENTWAKKPGVIYGTDNRQDIFAVTDPQVLQAADGTVALIGLSNVSESVNLLTDEVIYKIKSGRFKDSYNLCTSEPFAEQPLAASCSGFLVGSDLLVTAGHCVTGLSSCNSYAYVFNFRMKNNTDPNLKFNRNDVYFCKKLIKQFQSNTGADYSILQLDRAVVGHQPLAIRRNGNLATGEDVYVIGHPVGLPSKYSNNAKVRSTTKSDFFSANLDTYGGNSGSAVLNSRTHEVEGILVRGENDFVNRNGCTTSNVCLDNACRGEEITFIKNLWDKIPALGPLVSVSQFKLISDTNNDGILVPGEEAQFSVNVSNVGKIAANQLKIVLRSPNDFIELNNNQYEIAELPINSERTLIFSAKVLPQASCGSKIKIEARYSFTEPKAKQRTEQANDFTLYLGSIKQISFSANDLPQNIPDQNQEGIESTLQVSQATHGRVEVLVPVQIQHPYVKDLNLTLTSPDGTVAILWKSGSHIQGNLEGIFGENIASYQPLSVFSNKKIDGKWKLTVSDDTSGDTGSLEAWGLRFNYFSCDSKK